jgi:hypothetical protein
MLAVRPALSFSCTSARPACMCEQQSAMACVTAKAMQTQTPLLMAVVYSTRSSQGLCPSFYMRFRGAGWFLQAMPSLSWPCEATMRPTPHPAVEHSHTHTPPHLWVVQVLSGRLPVQPCLGCCSQQHLPVSDVLLLQSRSGQTDRGILARGECHEDRYTRCMCSICVGRV